MIRKRNDSVKSGVGIDKAEGENFTRQGRTDPYKSNPRGNWVSKSGGAYTNNDSGLTNKMANDDPEQGKYTLAGGARDIFDEVTAQDSDSGSRVVKSGRKS